MLGKAVSRSVQDGLAKLGLVTLPHSSWEKLDNWFDHHQRMKHVHNFGMLDNSVWGKSNGGRNKERK